MIIVEIFDVGSVLVGLMLLCVGGYAIVSGELNNEPFLPVLVGLEHTNLIVRTGLAIAFPRSPMTVANMGWDLQSFSNGRFQLGLGTQVKGHNENSNESK